MIAAAMHPLWNTIARGRLTGEQLARLDAYLDALIETNERLNLTRITGRADAEVRHVADALTLLDHLPDGCRTLADVGTGGGVPGVVLAIARPDVAVTLIDGTKKKLDAVAAMCDRVGVTNVRTLHARAEETETTAPDATDENATVSDDDTESTGEASEETKSE